MLSSKENYNIANNCAVLEQMFIVKSSMKSVKSIWPPSGGFVLQALLVLYFSSKIKSETSSLSKAIEAKFF